jgi:hypothetical protein
MSYCTNCGTKLANDALFCEQCGTQVYSESLTTEEVVQVVVDELNKEYYVEQLTKTIAFAVVAVIVSQLVLSVSSTPSDVSIFPSLLLAGIPSGWSIINHILGGWIIIGGPIGLIFLLFRFFLAVIIGIFALPIKIIYYIIKIRAASK